MNLPQARSVFLIGPCYRFASYIYIYIYIYIYYIYIYMDPFDLGVAAGRALALIRGRDYVVPADLDALVRDAFRHRLVLSYRALAEEVAPDSILDTVLAAVPTPQIDLGRRSAAASA